MTLHPAPLDRAETAIDAAYRAIRSGEDPAHALADFEGAMTMTGNELRSFRVDDLQLSQDQFALLIGKSRPTVWAWEALGDKPLPMDAVLRVRVLDRAIK